MTVHYEWDVEEVDEHGDIIQHWFQDSYIDCLKFVENNPDKNLDIVLVKTTDEERGWFYLSEYDTLPRVFSDAYNKNLGNVPKKYILEIERR